MEPEWPLVTIKADGWGVSIYLRDHEDFEIVALCVARLQRDVSALHAAAEAEAHLALAGGPNEAPPSTIIVA